MFAPRSGEDAPVSRRRGGLRPLPWIVGVSTVIGLLPLGVFVSADADANAAPFVIGEALAHSPTFLVLFGLSVVAAGRARRGERVPTSLVGAIIGAVLGAIGLMLGVLVLAFALQDGWVLLLYVSRTPLFLPLAAVAGAGLGAAVVGLGPRVFRRRSKG
jgi:hypothetical protein